jgi:hypothetical protein
MPTLVAGLFALLAHIDELTAISHARSPAINLLYVVSITYGFKAFASDVSALAFNFIRCQL